MTKKRKPTAAEREAILSWEKLKAAHARPLERGAKAKSVSAKRYSPQTRKPLLIVDTERDHSHIKSVDTGRGSTALRASQTYSGDKMLGISQMHKSNMVPVFNSESAIDITKMRR